MRSPARADAKVSQPDGIQYKMVAVAKRGDIDVNGRPRVMAMADLARKPAELAGLVLRKFRGQSRSGAILRTAAVAYLNRFLSIIASLLTVPFVLNHVGRERYGIWMTAIALSSIFTAADGGVTKGLIAMVAKAHGAGDRAAIRTLIASALATTMTFVFVLLAPVLAGVTLVDWQWALNLSRPELGREAAAVIATICTCYAASFPPTVIREARLGMLQGASVQLWDMAGTIVGFAGLVAAVYAGAGLVVIAGAWAGGPTLMRALAALTFLAGAGRDLVPSRAAVDRQTCRRLLAAGAVFTLYTVTQVLAAQSDQLLIARFLGTAAVADYAVIQRLFMQSQVIATLALIAQWPAYGEALGRCDFAWIRKHLNVSLIGYAIYASVFCGLLALLCRPILKLWVGTAIEASPIMIGTMAIYAAVSTVANVFAFFYMSLGLNRQLALSQLAMITIVLPVSVLLIPRIGPAGAAIAASIGYLVAFVVPGLWLKRSLRQHLHRHLAASPSDSLRNGK